MSNLFNIQKDLLSLYEEIREADGEITEEITNQLQITEEALQTKAVSFAYVIKQKEYESEIVDKEIKRLQSLKKSIDNTNERLKQTIKEAMLRFDISEIKGDTLKLSFRKSESVEITDEAELPAAFWNVKEVRTPDKTAIKEAIKSGEAISGAAISINQNLQIK
jgi:hypothetical protein